MASPEYKFSERNFYIVYLFMLVWKDQIAGDAPVAVERIRHTLTDANIT